MSKDPLDAGIPVLTEIIPAPSPVPSPTPSEQPALVEAAAPSTTVDFALWDEHEWTRMEREVRERVLQQVLDRVDFVLEQRVRDSLADVLQTSVERLATEIRAGLHQSIKDTVTRAVTQEIAKLQGTKS